MFSQEPGTENIFFKARTVRINIVYTFVNIFYYSYSGDTKILLQWLPEKEVYRTAVI